MADIDFGQLSEALDNKSDRDLRNVDTTAKADAVIDYQEPTSANNYTWYRKYKSGWVEQGGISDASTSGVSVTLPIEMTDANYTVVVGNGETTTNPDYTAYCSAQNRTATSFSFYVKGYGGNGTSYRCCWQVSGIAVN